MRNYREAKVLNSVMVALLRKAGIDMPEDCVLLHAYQDPGDFGKGFTRYIFESQEFDELPEGHEPYPWSLGAA